MIRLYHLNYLTGGLIYLPCGIGGVLAAYVACQSWAIDFHGHNMTAMNIMRFHGDNTFSSDHYTHLMDI